MTLADLLVRAIQLEWHEAVALVRDIVERAPIHNGSSTVPSLDQIELLPSGEVKIHGARPVDDPVQKLRHLLELLMGSQQLPPLVAERLLQAEASAEALAAALAYFERPNRQDVLQELYARATGSAPLPNADELIAQLRAATAVAAPAAKEERERDHAHRGVGILAAAGILLVSAVTGVIAYLNLGADRAAADASSILTEKVSGSLTSVTAAVGTAVSSLGERVGLTAAPTSAPMAATEPSQKPAPDIRLRAPRRSDRDRNVIEVDQSRADAPGRPAPVSSPAVDLSAMPTAAPEVVERVIHAHDPDAVYSEASPDVTTPSIVRPHLPKTLPEFLRAQNAPSIELLILADGSVASVRLIGPPRNVHDSMLLSAAKAWRFSPALKGGQPVAYRLAVPVAR